MSADNTSKSFLDLPGEVRFKVYAQLFRSTEVSLHNLAARSNRCENDKQNFCTSLMTVNKLIRQEATPIFLKETSFMATDCACWYQDYEVDEETEVQVPAISNIIIPCSMCESFLDPNDGFGRALSSLESRIDQDGKLNSLVCQPTVHTDFTEHDGGLELELDVLVNDMPKIFRKVEFTFCTCGEASKEKVFLVKIRRVGNHQKVGVHCTRREDVQVMTETFEMFDHDLKNVEWSSDVTGTSMDYKVAHEQFEEFLATL